MRKSVLPSGLKDVATSIPFNSQETVKGSRFSYRMSVVYKALTHATHDAAGSCRFPDRLSSDAQVIEIIKTKLASVSLCCKTHRYKTAKKSNCVHKLTIAQKLAITFMLVSGLLYQWKNKTRFCAKNSPTIF